MIVEVQFQSATDRLLELCRAFRKHYGFRPYVARVPRSFYQALSTEHPYTRMPEEGGVMLYDMLIEVLPDTKPEAADA
ncbi:MAG TPA: hypothetical protein PKZ27_02910 [Rhodocyclaceae bacterium]|nr:hypothetical protein [Burkholderiaceae bacterium]HRP74516.1 hypothetical protein [Rhodocyclaceae bacterium]